MLFQGFIRLQRRPFPSRLFSHKPQSTELEQTPRSACRIFLVGAVSRWKLRLVNQDLQLQDHASKVKRL
jgi:hypothetical protein